MPALATRALLRTLRDEQPASPSAPGCSPTQRGPGELAAPRPAAFAHVCGEQAERFYPPPPSRFGSGGITPGWFSAVNGATPEPGQ